MTIPIRKITTTPPIRRPSSRLGVAATTTTRTESENTTIQGSDPGREHEVPDHHRDDQRGERDDRDDVLRHADQHGRGHEQQGGDEVGLAQPADRPVPATRQHPAGRQAGRAPGVRGGDHRSDLSGRRHSRAHGSRTLAGRRPRRAAPACSSGGPGPEARLAARAPEQVAADQHLGAHRAPAHEARLAGPAVDVDRVAVGVGVAAPGRPGPPRPGRARCRSGRAGRRRPSAPPGRATSARRCSAAAWCPGRSGSTRCRNSTSAR